MNYNVKRFTRPLKGICACNNAVVKSIANLVNNNVDYRPYNKGFFIRQLGEAMENIDHIKDHVITEAIVPGQDPAISFIDGTNGSATQRIAFDITDEQINQGMLIITTESTSNEVKDVILVYPSEYNNSGNVTRTLNEEDYSDIFTTIPLSNADLNAMYTRAIEKYEANEWNGSMSFEDGLSSPIYDYKLYVYLFPA